MYALVYSLKDPAGTGVAKYLIDYFKLDRSEICRNSETCYEGKGFILAGFKEDTIYFDFLDERLPSNTRQYIVLSRHSSAKKVKSYTVHHTGNFGNEAPYGGKPGRLAVASPIVAHKLLLLLKEKAKEKNRISEYEVSYEATHHGPTEVNRPLCFIEIGSTIDEWKDPINHAVLGEALIEFLQNDVHECRVVAGVGGGHYPRKHTKKALTEGYCYGHIMAKYALPYLSFNALSLMIERSEPKPRIIVVEKKGTRKEHRTLIEQYASQYGLSIEYI